jgi:anti-sigma factor RsiW
MSKDPLTTTAEQAAIDEEIVAYLDGELDPAAVARVERRLAEDPAYRARLGQLQRAWDLLDALQRTEADDQFTQSTVAMVAIQAEQEARTQRLKVVRRRTLAWLAAAAAVAVAAVLAYAGVQHHLSRENRALVRDLPVIERVDEFLKIDSLEFLKQLQREHLFPAEVDDGV